MQDCEFIYRCMPVRKIFRKDWSELEAKAPVELWCLPGTTMDRETAVSNNNLLRLSSGILN